MTIDTSMSQRHAAVPALLEYLRGANRRHRWRWDGTLDMGFRVARGLPRYMIQRLRVRLLCLVPIIMNCVS
jgi:hypothetical protein